MTLHWSLVIVIWSLLIAHSQQGGRASRAGLDRLAADGDAALVDLHGLQLDRSLALARLEAQRRGGAALVAVPVELDAVVLHHGGQVVQQRLGADRQRAGLQTVQ